MNTTYTYDRAKFRMIARSPSHAYVNNLLAASSCTLLIVGLHFIFSRETFNHWTVMRCVQGTIAGVVTVSAAANEYSPQIAIALGCLGGIVFYLVSRQIFHNSLEDYCNVIAIHLVCAILGSVVAPFCVLNTDEDIETILLSFSWQLICLVALLALVSTVMSLIFGMLECCGILRNRSECLNHERANAAVQRGPPRSFLQRLFFPDSGCLYLQPSSTSGTRNDPSIGSRFRQYQTEIDKLEEGRSTAMTKPNPSVKIEETVTRVQPTGTRVRKARQVYTLPGGFPASIENKGGTGESVNNDLLEIERKQVLEKEIKCILDPIEELDEEMSQEVGENEVQRDIERYNAGDKNILKTESFTGLSDLNESSYQLRRTAKLMNLHHEFIKDELKVVLEPKRVDSSSSDSCDEDVVFTRTPNLNESIKDIVTYNHSILETNLGLSQC